MLPGGMHNFPLPGGDDENLREIFARRGTAKVKLSILNFYDLKIFVEPLLI